MNQQPTPVPPVPPRPDSAPAAAPDAHYQMPAVNPGQTTGIIGLVFAFVGLAPIGLILSIISTVKSSKGQSPRTLGIIGIVLNALAIVVFFFFIAIVLVSYAGIQERALDSKAQSEAYQVRKVAESYYAENGTYPQDITELSTMLNDTTVKVVPTPVTDNSTVGYKACGEDGASVEYLKKSSTVPVILYLGTGSFSTCS